jgi:hypothetical protein
LTEKSYTVFIFLYIDKISAQRYEDKLIKENLEFIIEFF